MRIPILSLLLAAGLFACGHDSHDHGGAAAQGADHGHEHGADGHDHDHDHAATPLLDGTVWSHYGHGVHAGETHPLADVLADPAAFADRVVRIGGPIRQVCQDTGSWIRLGTEDGELLVRFKDLAFFVPKAARGEAVVEGVLTVAAAGGAEPGATMTATGVAIAKGD